MTKSGNDNNEFVIIRMMIQSMPEIYNLSTDKTGHRTTVCVCVIIKADNVIDLINIISASIHTYIILSNDTMTSIEN